MYSVIVNPISGGGLALRRLPEVEAELSSRGLQYRVERTASAHDATRLVREAVRNRADAIVAVGGDGTFFDAANGLAGSDVPLIFVPLGTGNDFVKCLPLPKEPIEALRLQLDSPARRIDLGRMNEIYFLNVSGTGFDVDVLRCVDRHKDKGKGLKPYLLALVEALKNYRPAEALVSFDGGPEEPARFAICSIGNGRYIGGGMKAVPEADPGDGLFDVVIVDAVPRFTIPILIAFYIAGLHVKVGLGKLHRCRRFTLKRPGMTVNLDGELRETDEANYELLAQGLCVRLPGSDSIST